MNKAAAEDPPTIASNLDIHHLCGTHDEHDKFIRAFVKSPPVDGFVLQALDALLTSQMEASGQQTTTIGDFVKENISKNPSNIQSLALYLLLKYFPVSWSSIVEDAFILLQELLTVSGNYCSSIYPPNWTAKIFDVENLFAPGEIKGVIFGIDPISKDGYPSDYATGFAFCFDVPADVERTFIQSTMGLCYVYGLRTDYTKPATFKLFFKEKQLVLVNFIRTIQFGQGKSGSSNYYLMAWTKFNVKWLDLVNSTVAQKPVSFLIFQNEHFPFDKYCENAVMYRGKMEIFENDFNEILSKLPKERCSHPSYCTYLQKEHCLSSPKAYYQKDRDHDAKVNASVLRVQSFMKEIGADPSLCLCRWPRCKTCGRCKQVSKDCSYCAAHSLAIADPAVDDITVSLVRRLQVSK